ncbi:MAG TPA: sensor histidine kinase, partial [Acidimicrobiia bacterium]
MAVGTMAVATIGALVAVRADTRVPGWLLLAFAVPWAATWAIYAMVDALVTEGVIDLVPAQLLIGAAETAGICSMFGMFGAFLTVPDGRLPSRWGRPLAVSLVIFLLAWVIHTFFLAGQITDPLAYVNRASLASLEGAELSPTFEAITIALTFIGLVAMIAIAATLIDRYRSSAPEARQQLKWVLVGAMSVLFWMALWVPQWESAAGQTAQAVLPGLGLISLAVGFGLSLFKYRLWDVDFVIRRSLVYGTLWLAIALVYAGVAAGLGLIAGSRFSVGVAIGLTVAATLLFQPARHRLERLADRLVFGVRESPIAALQEFGSSVGVDSPSRDIARELADVIRRVLGARAVEVRVEGSEPVVAGEWGEGVATTISLKWTLETFGHIRCLPRRGERFDADDVRVVEALASQAALTISHARLASRMVTAQEAERRKIERDLHDGVQQDLATQIGQLALARSRANSDPDLASKLAEIQAEMQRTLVEIRHLAQGIHPSVLRDGGLLAAVEDRCSRLPLEVSIDADTHLYRTRYAADVEAAAYFMVTEAVANVVKHAQASSVSIAIADNDGHLIVAVADDGVGYDPDRGSTGTGIGGLADRLRALGGELAIESHPGAGTTVRARVPVHVPGETG